MDVGLAINPETEINANIEELFERNLFDTALIMTVSIYFLIIFNKHALTSNYLRAWFWRIEIYGILHW